MAEGPRGKATRQRGKVATPEEYNTFIQQIGLQTVWLASATIDNAIGAEAPDRTDVSVNRSSSWGAIGGGFYAFDTYKLVLGAPNDPAATIDVTFGLEYRSELAMTDALFEPFKQFNLPLNAWPYAREFVANATARMNWIPFTLPALRLGAVSEPDADGAQEPPPTIRARRVLKDLPEAHGDPQTERMSRGRRNVKLD